MKTITTAIMMILATTLFISCNKSDDESVKEPVKEETLSKIVYYMGEGRDLLKLVDISVTYNDDKGAEKTETITSLPWVKEYKDMALTLPRVMKMTVEYKKKASIPNQDSYTLWQELGISGETNISVIGGNSSGVTKITRPKAMIDAYIENLIEKVIVRTLEVEKS